MVAASQKRLFGRRKARSRRIGQQIDQNVKFPGEIGAAADVGIKALQPEFRPGFPENPERRAFQTEIGDGVKQKSHQDPHQIQKHARDRQDESAVHPLESGDERDHPVQKEDRRDKKDHVQKRGERRVELALAQVQAAAHGVI